MTPYGIFANTGALVYVHLHKTADEAWAEYCGAALKGYYVPRGYWCGPVTVISAPEVPQL